MFLSILKIIIYAFLFMWIWFFILIVWRLLSFRLGGRAIRQVRRISR